jgi:hypothetical protein
MPTVKAAKAGTPTPKKLGQSGDKGADGNRTERHEGEAGTRSSATVVDHVHRQNPPHNSSPNAENRARSESISVEKRRRRDDVGDTSISFSARSTTTRTIEPPVTHYAQYANLLRA